MNHPEPFGISRLRSKNPPKYWRMAVYPRQHRPPSNFIFKTRKDSGQELRKRLPAIPEENTMEALMDGLVKKMDRLGRKAATPAGGSVAATSTSAVASGGGGGGGGGGDGDGGEGVQSGGVASDEPMEE
ncbi:transcription factor jun-D-like [Scaptodrosophila lebanonensis]|uniref:Transcription factor jun-D-like n=1 Tax=Drosophila lebanonensis TaxID=7225 RepID=A0A6J2TTG3_DROLE|nr:transcription factor jun-D-like [Scaptodrosophila lebanonensis]